MSKDNPIGTAVTIDFRENSGNVLRIVANTMRVEFLVLNETTNTYEVTTDIPDLTGMVPNDTVPFRIRFYNTSGATQQVSVIMTNITTDNPDILQYMYVGMSGGDGYINSLYGDIVIPEKVFYCLSDATDHSTFYDMSIYEALYIPPTGENDFVELNGYFWFNRTAEKELSGISLTIGKFRIIL